MGEVPTIYRLFCSSFRWSFLSGYPWPWEAWGGWQLETKFVYSRLCTSAFGAFVASQLYVHLPLSSGIGRLWCGVLFSALLLLYGVSLATIIGAALIWLLLPTVKNM